MLIKLPPNTLRLPPANKTQLQKGFRLGVSQHGLWMEVGATSAELYHTIQRPAEVFWSASGHTDASALHYAGGELTAEDHGRLLLDGQYTGLDNLKMAGDAELPNFLKSEYASITFPKPLWRAVRKLAKVYDVSEDLVFAVCGQASMAYVYCSKFILSRQLKPGDPIREAALELYGEFMNFCIPDCIGNTIWASGLWWAQERSGRKGHYAPRIEFRMTEPPPDYLSVWRAAELHSQLSQEAIHCVGGPEHAFPNFEGEDEHKAMGGVTLVSELAEALRAFTTFAGDNVITTSGEKSAQGLVRIRNEECDLLTKVPYPMKFTAEVLEDGAVIRRMAFFQTRAAAAATAEDAIANLLVEAGVDPVIANGPAGKAEARARALSYRIV